MVGKTTRVAAWEKEMRIKFTMGRGHWERTHSFDVTTTPEEYGDALSPTLARTLASALNRAADAVEAAAAAQVEIDALIKPYDTSNIAGQ